MHTVYSIICQEQSEADCQTLLRFSRSESLLDPILKPPVDARTSSRQLAADNWFKEES